MFLPKTISEPILNIYRDHELIPQATIRKFRLVQTEGSRRVERLVDFYNLDMILAIVKKMLGKGPEEGN